MQLTELWRYPVKSMAGEMLPEAVLGPTGIPGDRALYVVDGREQIVSARTRPRLLLHRAGVDERGEPTVDGIPWDDPEVGRRVGMRPARPPGWSALEAGERFDILPLLVATDGAIAALGVDRRRFRPNLVIGGVPGLMEREWEGRFLKIGAAVIGLHSLRQRCIMTTWDPDTGAQDRSVLRRIHREFDGSLALNAWAAVGGRVAVGDRVELLQTFEAALPPVLGRLT